jgi:hypothetical protein
MIGQVAHAGHADACLSTTQAPRGGKIPSAVATPAARPRSESNQPGGTMRIGLLPLLAMSCGHPNVSAGAPRPQPRPTSTTPIRLIETNLTQPAMRGGDHVDLDH